MKDENMRKNFYVLVHDYICGAKHEYKFSDKEEFLKFVRGEMAIDGYGNNCNRSYYEYIKEAYTKTDIDVITLYQMDIANDYNIEQGLEER